MPSPSRYRLRELIARGGMAEVWRAEDVSTEPPTKVAVKRILPELAQDPTLCRLFEDEAAVLARLKHDAIVRFYDAGVLDERPFHALELIDGPDAGSVLTERTFPPELALYVTERVAAGLAYAHELEGADGTRLGIVHRDVSPSNVLCARDGRVLVTDFGIALGQDRRERTATGLTKGKAAYMSPEQTLGSKVDARTDVFALGCTLHALATGKSPLADPDAMAGLLAGEAVPLAPNLSSEVRTIVEKAIAPRAAARYPTMRAMHEALTGALARSVEAPSAATLQKFLASLAPGQKVVSGMDTTLPAKRGASKTDEISGPETRRSWRLPLMLLLGVVAALGAVLAATGTMPGAAGNDPIPTGPIPTTTIPGEPTLSGPESPTTEPPIVAEEPATVAEGPLIENAAPTERRRIPTERSATRDGDPTESDPAVRDPAERDPAEGAAPEAPESPVSTVPTEPTAPASWGVVNFRLPRDARVTLDGGRTPFRDVSRGHACDTTGLCHLAAGRHALAVTLADGTRESASLCVTEGATVRVVSPLSGELGCD